jgi:hypothetical protein
VDLVILLIAAAAIVFLAGAVQGLTGSGSALVMVPTLVLVMEPKDVIALALVHGTFLNTVLLATRIEHARPGKVGPLFVAGLIGLPVGAVILYFISSSLLKVGIGAFIILFAVLLLLSRNGKGNGGPATTLTAGFLSGVLNGSISMSGPPIILSFAREGMPKEEFRANLAMFFLALNLFTIPVFTLTGILTLHVWAVSATLLVPLAVGMSVGMAAARRFGEGLFRRTVLFLAVTTGLFSLVTGLLELLG